MKKIFLLILFIIISTLTACSSDSKTIIYDKYRDESYVSSENHLVYFKTDESGKLIDFSIDKLLTIEEIMIANPTIDNTYTYNDVSIYTEVSTVCSSDLELVPTNIKIQNTYLKYKDDVCGYIEVDKEVNDYKVSQYAKQYLLSDVIPYTLDVEVYIVAFDEDLINKFVNVSSLAHTYKGLGIYSLVIDEDTSNFISDMKIYEQLVLKYQTYDLSLSAIESAVDPEDINALLNGSTSEAVIDDFEDVYSSEIVTILEFEEDYCTNCDSEAAVEEEAESTEEPESTVEPATEDEV